MDETRYSRPRDKEKHQHLLMEITQLRVENAKITKDLERANTVIQALGKEIHVEEVEAELTQERGEMNEEKKEDKLADGPEKISVDPKNDSKVKIEKNRKMKVCGGKKKVE